MSHPTSAGRPPLPLMQHSPHSGSALSATRNNSLNPHCRPIQKQALFPLLTGKWRVSPQPHGRADASAVSASPCQGASPLADTCPQGCPLPFSQQAAYSARTSSAASFKKPVQFPVLTNSAFSELSRAHPPVHGLLFHPHAYWGPECGARSRALSTMVCSQSDGLRPGWTVTPGHFINIA